MNTQKLLTGTVVGTVFVFLYDWLIYGMLLKGTMTMVEGYDREQPDYLWILIGMFIFMLFFTYFYGKSAEAGSKVQQGLRYGVMIGLWAGLGYGLIMYAIQEARPLSDYWIDTVVHIVRFALAGIIIAYVTGIPATAGEGDRGLGEDTRTGGGGG